LGIEPRRICTTGKRQQDMYADAKFPISTAGLECGVEEHRLKPVPPEEADFVDLAAGST